MATSDNPPSPSPRERLARAFSVTAEGRSEVVHAMLEGHVKQAPIYWLQLVLALGLATLGLVLNSTGVIIGAMLIAPLMGPIVGLAMGLAIGSPLLVFRSLLRVLGSIVVVVGASSLITLALPYQAVTSEIAARTSPTALDLLVAMFCAFSAAFTTMRPGSDTVSTAAGTSIGISLVPPLCVVGFGLGTFQAHLASGAALLFVANLCAILFFSSVTFLLFGFDHVDFETAENEHPPRHTLVYRAAAFVWTRFGSHSSPALRLLMPLVLVAAVYVPLRQALAEVSWEVMVRSRVHGLLSDLPLAQRAVRSQVSVDRHQVRLRLVVVAGATQAAELQRTLETQAAAIAGVTPSVEVVAVPDLAALQEATRERVVPLPEPPRPPDVEEVHRRLMASLARDWPEQAAGPLLSWRLGMDATDQLVVDLVHLGPPLGAAAEPLLASRLSSSAGTRLTVSDVALPAGELSAEVGQGVAWLPALGRSVESARRHGLKACITVPAEPVRPRTRATDSTASPDATVRAAVQAEASRAVDAVRMSEGPRWSVRLQREPCVAPTVPVAATSSSAPAASSAGRASGPVGSQAAPR